MSFQRRPGVSGATPLDHSDAIVRRLLHLERSRAFRDLSKPDVWLLAQIARERSVEEDAVIFAPDDAATALFIVKRGFIALHRLIDDGRDLTASIVGPGDIFGEAALLDSVSRSSFATAITAAQVYVAPVSDLTRICTSHPALLFRITREVIRRGEASENRLSLAMYARAPVRIRLALLHLAQNHGLQAPDGSIWIRVSLRHRDIAALAGTARETASSELSRLKRNGLLRIDNNGMFSLPDIDSLAAQSLGDTFPGKMYELYRDTLKRALSS